MTRYENEAEAAEAGFTVVHEPERARYALYAEGERLIGEAHYRLISDDAIDFDHTVVVPEFRRTGLSGVLAHRAVTGPAVEGRRVQASCWFIDGYLHRHPELLR
ncbi:GNAT family N-acetyltransferase [Leucobacter sp. USHLN153]|uniref:GNAT family N-acetyltransferase n=1 Tax=Leucobacter sp. USHLN153 TaxID=3081268 RepID=UPI0030180AF6